ncbi:hypothetical protein WJX72_006987 [[Myrmecia] bisecta]|uniref:Alpha-amylase n=1 Tax=[Myrmecia] bisecta TaxID=41462 RepID=A0AAW1PPQ7_9CHLO
MLPQGRLGGVSRSFADLQAQSLLRLQGSPLALPRRCDVHRMPRRSASIPSSSVIMQRIREAAKEASQAAVAARRAEEQDPVADLRRKLGAVEADLKAADDLARSREFASIVAALKLRPVDAPPPVPEYSEPAPLPPFTLGDETAKAEGSGYEILLQGFNWESHRQNWYQRLMGQADWFAELGITMMWLPPPTESVAPQGYMPLDLYNLNCAYGSEQDLRKCVSKLQSVGIKVLGDCVLNHRCAHSQDGQGVWNQFGGRLAWDATAIVSDDRKFRGRGNPSSGEKFDAAPNVDHSQDFVKRDVAEWMRYLRADIGFDGWRLDFVKGFHGSHVKDYVEATQPLFTVGEFWDSLEYSGGISNHNQDKHRQRIVDWIHQAAGTATAFDVTTKGILHAVFERNEFWRLRDGNGKPPGLMGFWPSRSTTFLENHDTGSTQGHWRFPNHAIEAGYAYILTHPGTPCIFYDHLDQLSDAIQRLVAVRRRHGIHCRSEVVIRQADDRVYVAEIDRKVLLKIGNGDYSPNGEEWQGLESGPMWKVWERK